MDTNKFSLFFSIQVQEERSGANSVYSYIVEPSNHCSATNTTDLRAQRQIVPTAPNLAAPVPAGISAHYETIDNPQKPQTKANRVIPPPPTVDPPPTPGDEDEVEGSGVTYTTLLSDPVDEGVSYTTITRVLGDPPTDTYSVVHKGSVGSRK